MPQTSVSASMPKAFPGMKGDSRKDGHDRSYYNSEASAEMPFGICVAQGSADDAAILPAAASAKLVGVIIHSHTYDSRVDFGTTGLKPKTTLSVMSKGSIWVLVEQAVTRGDIGYVRIGTSANDGTKTQKGAWRKDADGTARVITVTPTAANDTDYGLRVSVGDDDFTFNVRSDASATATEIADAFRTQMAANAEFTALITASGTTTLVLTAAVAGVDFSAENAGPGTLGIVSTTAAAPSAVQAAGTRFLTSASAGEVALLDVDFLVTRAIQAAP